MLTPSSKFRNLSTEALHDSASDIDRRPAANTDGGKNYVTAATNEISDDEDNIVDESRPRAGALGGIIIAGGIITCCLLVLLATKYREKDEVADCEDGEDNDIPEETGKGVDQQLS